MLVDILYMDHMGAILGTFICFDHWIWLIDFASHLDIEYTRCLRVFDCVGYLGHHGIVMMYAKSHIE